MLSQAELTWVDSVATVVAQSKNGMPNGFFLERKVSEKFRFNSVHAGIWRFGPYDQILRQTRSQTDPSYLKDIMGNFW